MKFFSLCLFVLSSVFAIAYRPLPEQDRQYLNQERDENGFGCVGWDFVGYGKSIQQADGTWVDQHPQRVCDRYCRPPRSGDKSITVRCYSDMSRLNPSETYLSPCLGVEDNEEDAKEEAMSVCAYDIRQYCRGNSCRHTEGKDIRRYISCDPAKVCFRVYYDEDGTIKIWNF